MIEYCALFSNGKMRHKAVKKANELDGQKIKSITINAQVEGKDMDLLIDFLRITAKGMVNDNVANQA